MTSESIELPKQIDTSLVDHLLTLSPEERLDAHEAARELIRDLQQAGKDYYATQKVVQAIRKELNLQF